MLLERWLTLCSKLNLEGRHQWEIFNLEYSHTNRSYHNLEHIKDCLKQLDSNRDLAKDPVAVEFAIWFHDLIYNTESPSNEEDSAQVAKDFLKGTAICETVVELILATKHQSKTISHDQALICDIDLSILGRDPEIYRHYSEAIRQEYHWVPSADYSEGRRAVLSAFLERDSIYILPHFQSQLEDQARSNLLSELEQLA